MTNVAAIEDIAASLFQDVPGFKGWSQRKRPRICPFDRLIGLVPDEARILDVGCGSGLFLGLLVEMGKRPVGVGFDMSRDAIAVARRTQNQYSLPATVTFELQSVEDDWPGGLYDVVSMIDVMHHIPPAEQSAIFRLASSRLKPGGMMLYKDIASDDRLRSVANRLHDLILAQQWIHYLPRDQARKAAADAGLAEESYQRVNCLWYPHEIYVFRKV